MTLVVGTSIVDVWQSDPATLAASHARIRSCFPGRFYLGLGSGHAPQTEASGQRYVRPLSKLRDFIAQISDQSSSAPTLRWPARPAAAAPAVT
jgi:alkanesulfonate monooxygenase SsuD/methylene tetrahydromethanopterin reductase-like flavin-dependent oxidoreductase (luciferase family)